MKPTLIVHGGAWRWSDRHDAPKRVDIQRAVQAGWDVLKNGGSAQDAVEQAIIILEDAPLFDAGTGSHLNANGQVELDALFCDGTARTFGAVAAVKRIKNPITLARRIMKTDHCFFVAEGAEEIAGKLGVPLIANMDLVTDTELDAFRRQDTSGSSDTVGALAIDSHGHIAAGTSTGGTPRKAPGRVGDSPLYGAGAYADDAFGAAGATGKGENSMRTLLSKFAVDQMAAGQTAQDAANAAIQHVNSVITPSMLGIITLDANGNVGFAHSTDKIAVGWVDNAGEIHVAMRKDC